MGEIVFEGISFFKILFLCVSNIIFVVNSGSKTKFYIS